MTVNDFHSFLQGLPLRTAPAKAVWAGASKLAKAPFEKSASKPGFNPLKTEHYRRILPIEAFKTDPGFLAPAEPELCFRSSGTTSKERSTAYFSHDGSLLYKGGALRAFYHVLGDFFADPLAAPGISLVGPLTEEAWSNSSLARMISWIGEFSKVSYGDASNLSAILSDSSQPVWLFGTAFHFVHLFDDGFQQALPEGSVVIETGGTKGRSRSVDRIDLFTMINSMFQLPLNRIVSEYGMAELACQAYDWVSDPQGETVPLACRSFRFPSWVKAGCSEENEQNMGALVVDDPLRIDCPFPIRTQDRAAFDSSGGFRLLGRIQSAPSKGCSLIAEDALTGLSFRKGAESWLAFDDTTVAKRIELLIPRLREFLGSKELEHLLAAEFGASLGAMALEDLQQSLPTSPEAWLTALSRSIGGGVYPASWLFLLPATHSIGAFYPLIFSYLLELDATVRIPDGPGKDGLGKLATFINEMPGAKLTKLESSFRVSKAAAINADRIFCFGSNETLSTIKKITGKPVSGFGTHLTASLIEEEPTLHQIGLLAKDLSSLAGRGCFSSQVVFFTGTYLAGEKLKEALAKCLSNVGLSFKLEVIKRPDQLEKLDDAIPIILLESKSIEAVRPWIKEMPDLKRISASGKLHPLLHGVGCITTALGRANIATWDGTHEGRSLFNWEADFGKF